MDHIFKAYDIRGIFPKEVNEDFAHTLGRAIAMYFTGEDIIVGRDARIGSEKLARALIEGITEQGCNVLDIGMCSTPMLCFAAQEHPAVMITASHNPKEYNGFKICAKGGMPLGLSDGLSQLKQLMEQRNFGRPKHKGKSRRKDILSAYASHVKAFKGKLKPLKVVVDAGNGVQGAMIPKVFARLPVKIIPLFFELDGNFPNRPPNPLKQGALEHLQKAVRQNKANFGVAFDADGDRAVFVDEKGAIARADHVLALFANYLLKTHAHAKILYDLRSSRIVKESVTKNGGVAVMTRVGHTFIAHVMKEEGALLAGELSGHYYFRDNFCADSGDIAALMMMSLISEEKKPLSNLLASLKKYSNSPELTFPAEHAQQTMEKVEKAYSDQGQVYHIDGLSVEFPDWWFNIRPSLTEPVLKLNVEANTKALLDRKVAELKRLLS